MKVDINWSHGGWRFSAEGLKSDPSPTYYDAIQRANEAGHAIDNGGWKHRLLSWNFNFHALDGYPDWEIENPEADKYSRHPAFVKLTHVRRRAGDVESSALANAWDDLATADFYQRDWTDDGIPFVDEGETYWSGWWFQTAAERDRFVAWQAAAPLSTKAVKP